PPPLPQLPPEEGPGGVPLAHPRAGLASVTVPARSVPIIAPGRPAPDFTLATYVGDPFTRASLQGRVTVLVFYPFAFSPVCNDQLSVYNELLDDFEAAGATLYGVSCDAVWSLEAFKDKLGLRIAQLSDFEPKGATCRAFGVLHPSG